MPPADDIQAWLAASWRIMTGRPDAIRRFDFSVDGFWNSFFAVVVALPVLLVDWVPRANDLAYVGDGLGTRLGIVARLATADIATWLVPLVLFALVARAAGLRDRLVPFVVTVNWGSALLIWFMLPAYLVRLVSPDSTGLSDTLGLAIALASLVLLWRLTNVAIARGPAMASAVFAAMLVASFVVMFATLELLGVGPSAGAY